MIIKGKNPHGGQIYDKKIHLDFSVNINPLGIPRNVMDEAVKALNESEQYPDGECMALRRKLAVREKCSYNHIICGNGGAEIIFQFAAALKPENALIIEPTFSEYRQSLTVYGCDARSYIMTEAKGFDVNKSIEEILPLIDEECDVVYLCNPNNPTGTCGTRNNILRLLEKCRKTGTFLFLDESFGSLCQGYEEFSLKSEIERTDNLFILKSMTKIYAMAGIRLGYGLCSNEELLEKMSVMSQCWNVSHVAQRAGNASLDCEEYVEAALKLLDEERKYLAWSFRKLGIKAFPGRANYIMIYSEVDLYDLLLEKGILIRSCDNYMGLGKGYYRVAIKNHKENVILMKTIADAMKG